MRFTYLSSVGCCALVGLAICVGAAEVVPVAPTAEEQAVVARALAAGNAGRLEEAVGVLDGLISAGTRWEGPYLLRSKIRLAQQDAPGALSDVRAALERNPGSVPAILQNAQILLATKQEQAAITALEAANKEYPGSKPLAMGLAQVLCGAGKFEGAVTVLEGSLKAGKVGDEDAPMLRLLALAYARTNHPDKALKITGALLGASKGMDLETQNLQLGIFDQMKDGMGMLATADGMLTNPEFMKAHPELRQKLTRLREGVVGAWVKRDGAVVPLVHDLRMRPKDEAAQRALAAAVEKLAGTPESPWAELVLPTHAAAMDASLGRPAEGESAEVFARGVMEKWRERKAEVPARPVMGVYGKRPEEFVAAYQGAEDDLQTLRSTGRWDEVVALCVKLSQAWPAGRIYHAKGFALAMKGDAKGTAEAYAIAAGLRAMEMMEHPSGAHEASISAFDKMDAKHNRPLQALGAVVGWRDGKLSADQKVVMEGALALGSEPARGIALAGAYTRLTDGDSYDARTHVFERDVVQWVAGMYRAKVLAVVAMEMEKALAANQIERAGELIPAVKVFKAPMFAMRVGEEVFNSVAMYYALRKEPEKRDEAIAEVYRSAKCTPATFVLWGQALEEKGKKGEAMLAFNAGAGGREAADLKEPMALLCARARDRLEGNLDSAARDALYLPIVNASDKAPIDGNPMLLFYALDRIKTGKKNGPMIYMVKSRTAMQLGLYDSAYRYAKDAIDGGTTLADEAWVIRANSLVERGRPGDAALVLAETEAGLKANPKNAWLYYHQSQAHRLQGKRVEAIADLTAALAVSDKNALYYKERSELLEAEGRLKEATDDLDKFVEMTGDVGMMDEGKRLVRLHQMLLEEAMGKLLK